jgi:hypothetical protein
VGGSVTEFSLPTASSAPWGIPAGPDGALWFTEVNTGKIGRISTSGTITEFTIPTPNSAPLGIVAGPDGNLWFAESNTSKIGRVTAGGTFMEFPTPTVGGHPAGITSGPDGALWFTEYPVSAIGRIATSGTMQEFPLPTAFGRPYGIVTGPDRNMWFAESGTGVIGQAIVAPVPVLQLASRAVPASVVASQGATVVWTFLGQLTHIVYDASGMALFGSGPRSTMSYYAFRFVGAGTYYYKDTAFNGALGKVKVPLKVQPSAGTTSTTFTVTWAAAPPPSGFVFDLQVKRPGSSVFVDLMVGVTGSKAAFVPDAGPGIYSFQSRIRSGSGWASQYSPVKDILVS